LASFWRSFSMLVVIFFRAMPTIKIFIYSNQYFCFHLCYPRNGSIPKNGTRKNGVKRMKARLKLLCRTVPAAIA
jgi:hypothetical protein